MFEVLLANKSKKLEDEAKKAGFSKVLYIDQKNIVLIQTDNKEELRKQISRAYSKKQKIVVLGSTDEINRIALEDKRVSILLGPEFAKKKDFMKYRNSGLNHVLCRLANKNKIAIGISMSSIKDAKKQERAEKIGRLMQNIALCKKYDTITVLASFGKKVSSPYILRSFGLSMGMSTEQSKKSMNSAHSLLA